MDIISAVIVFTGLLFIIISKVINRENVKEWTNDEGRQDHLQVFVDSKKYAKFLKTSAW